MTLAIKQGITYDDVTIMPRWSNISSRNQCDISTSVDAKTILSLPIVASPMRTVCGQRMALEMARLGGLGIVHRFMSPEQRLFVVKLIRKTYPKAVVGMAFGLDAEEKYVLEDCKSYVDIFMLDTAHAGSDRALYSVKQARDIVGFKSIIAGSIASPIAAQKLAPYVDGLRVGIGGGSLCETRVRTGIGVPNLTSLIECAEASNLPIIADGGIRTPGDVAKALSIGNGIMPGVCAVMIGSLLAGTDESPGGILSSGIWPHEKLTKEYYGEASAKAQEGKSAPRVEGNYKQVPYKGSAERIINDICSGLKSSMSYTGSTTLKEFQLNAEFIQNTQAGIAEGRPHLLY